MFNDYFSLVGFVWVIIYLRSLRQAILKKRKNISSDNMADHKRRLKMFYSITSFLLLCIIGFFDYYTGYRISFMPFYIAPIALATLFVGYAFGITISILSAVAWLGADMASGHPYNYNITPYWNASVRMLFFLAVVLAIQLKNSLYREKELTRMDYLTNIPNRRHFYELAEREIEMLKRYNRAFSLAFLDFDDFKNINDTFGHRAGDIFLREAAQTIKNNARGSDVVARIGGDEFVVLLSETDAEGSSNYIKRLNRRIHDIMQNKAGDITMSIGIVTCNKTPASVDEIIAKADELMYSAKKKGKNRIEQIVL